MLETIISSAPVLIEDLGMLYANKESKYKFRHGLYKCSCGKDFRANSSAIKSGHTKSCGCIQKAIASKTHKSHGLYNHNLYGIWKSMINRTIDKNNINFKNYGGRGIKVCERWLNIENFIDDMYPSYQKGLTIDRIDNNNGYYQENCRWTTREVQNRNTRVLRLNNTSGYRGVSWSNIRNKWLVQITISGKNKYLGAFLTPIDAAIAYDQYVIENTLEHSINGV